MNSSQRYYAFLALTSNQDFVEEIRQLRKSQSFLNYNFPVDGFENPADADAFVLAQHKAIQDGKLVVSEHPLWRLEQNLTTLLEQYGLPVNNDKNLYETAKTFFFLNEVYLVRDHIKLFFNHTGSRDEITVSVYKDTKRADLEKNITAILSFRDKFLGKTNRKQSTPQFMRDLVFYKIYLRQRNKNPNSSIDELIKYVYEEIGELPEEENPDMFTALLDIANARRLIKKYNRDFGTLRLLSK